MKETLLSIIKLRNFLNENVNYFQQRQSQFTTEEQKLFNSLCHSQISINTIFDKFVESLEFKK